MRRFFSSLLLFCLVVSGQAETGGEGESTVIQSDRLEIVGGESGNRFIFSGSVRITGADFVATCEQMEVLTSGDNQKQEDRTGFGAIDVIEATGSVKIVQGTREATAGKALIYPADNRVVLEENPVVRDAKGKVSGYRMILHGETRRITVEPGPEGERPTVELPSVRSLDEPQSESGVQ